MGMNQFIQSLAALPQIVDSVKNMNEQEKEQFVGLLGLENEERETAINLISCFQEGRSLDLQEQQAAQGLFEKALQMNDLSVADLFKVTMNGG